MLIVYFVKKANCFCFEFLMAPKSKLAVTADYSINKITFSVTATRFSEVQIQDFQWVDTPAQTQAEADALFSTATDIYKAAIVSDLNISYRINSSFTFTFGANNLFNVYPTPQFDGWTDQGGFSDSVQMGSDGTYIFGRLGFKF